MRFIAAAILIIMASSTGAAESLWVNNITVNEYNMTWSYTETFTNEDSIAYRIGIDKELGNNDSFINAWELLLADRDARKNLRDAIEKEPDVRINNETSWVEVLDVDSELSSEIIGKTHSPDAIVNRYRVTYRFKDSVLNAGSIWFLGEAKSPVTIVMPAGADVVDISGMDNVTKIMTDHLEISGSFREISKERGEINLNLTKNTSIPETNVSNVTSSPPPENTTAPMTEVVSMMREVSIIIAVLVIVVLIYVFGIRRK
ncbi:MAG: hypothetical protein OIN88_03725 [Candidatus Methanoperedens sp.]|nr:hypothetical protein [Candidatus Methanoperedens sp.]MCZ7358915.1 hypothetical protein [Candidatus Methanoperedens sp.]